jgi:hypothetical protein
MDLFSIVGKIWQHKKATIPVIILTVLGAFYILEIKAPTYQATSSILFVNPPGPPTPAQIAKNPSLGNVNTSNTFVSYGNLDVIANAVIGVVNADSDQLVQAGASPGYQLTLSADTGLPPIIEIAGVGSSAQQAILSANLVTKEALTSLRQIQAQQNVDPTYMIKGVELYAPHNAQASASGRLRTFIAVMALGAILLFIVISVNESIALRRARGSTTDGRSAHDGHGPPAAQPPLGQVTQASWDYERDAPYRGNGQVPHRDDRGYGAGDPGASADRSATGAPADNHGQAG